MVLAFYSTLDVTQCTRVGVVFHEKSMTGIGYVVGWQFLRNVGLIPSLSILEPEAFPTNVLNEELRTYSFGPCSRDLLLHLDLATVSNELTLTLTFAKKGAKDYIIQEKGEVKEFPEILRRLFSKLVKKLGVSLDDEVTKRINHISDASLIELVDFAEKAVSNNRLNLDEVAFRKAGPDLASALFLRVAESSHDIRRMEYYTKRYLKADPYYARILTVLASIEMVGGKPKEGMQHAKEVFAINPYFPHLYLALSGSQEFSVEDLLKAAKIAIYLMPSNAAPHYNYCLLLAKAGETYKTLEHIERAIVFFPHYDPLILLRARTLERLGKKKAAIKEMESYLSVKSSQQRATLGHEYYYAALFAKKNGDEQKQKEWAQKAQGYPDATAISSDIKKLL